MMATRPAPQPLDALLAVLPSMPRPILTRLTARLIERLDELDGDPDLEETGDREAIDEREPEDFDGGYPDDRPRWSFNTSLNR